MRARPGSGAAGARRAAPGPAAGRPGTPGPDVRADLLRDLHDAVTHRLTAIVVQADAAQTRLPDRSATAASLTAIAASGRAALVELRALLVGLHEPDGPTGPPAAPGLSDLPALLVLAAPPGRAARLTVHGIERPLPAPTQAALYRIVQESVTNALRHTGALPSAITVRYGEGQVELEVRTDPPAGGRPAGTGGAGLGSAAMRERAAGLGGELVAGPRPDGGYRVLTRLPDPGPA